MAAVILLSATASAQISQSLQSGNFEFQNSSSSDLLTIYPNGNVSVPGSINVGSCTGCAGGSAETLSETLAAGNKAGNNNLNMTSQNITNVQKIEFNDTTVEIGDTDTKTSSFGDIAIGGSAVASSSLSGATAIGYQAKANNTNSVAIGDGSLATGTQGGVEGSGAAVALGGGSSALGFGSMALGVNSEATAQGAVAIGRLAKADESYTVEIGSSTIGYNLSVHGDIVASGDITSQGNADLAEIYSSEEDYSAGTVVSVSSGSEEVEASDERFEDVAGVVSKSPGFVLNKGDIEDGIEVALEGRVPVKVAEKVEKGDDLAAGVNGKAVPCGTEDVELSESASDSEIVEAMNSLSRNQACLESSFGEALNSSENGYVEVMLD